MVIIGFSKDNDKKQIEEFMSNNGIVEFNDYVFDDVSFYDFQAKPNYDAIYFYEIETDSLDKYGLCCFGERKEYLKSKNHATKDATHLSNYHKYEHDISFWLSFVEKSCERFGAIALYKYYPGLSTHHTVSVLSPVELTADVMLDMENNHLVIVQNQQSIKCKRYEHLIIGAKNIINQNEFFDQLLEFEVATCNNEYVSMEKNEEIDGLSFFEIKANFGDWCLSIANRNLLNTYKEFEKYPVYRVLIEKVQKIEQNAEKWCNCLTTLSRRYGKVALLKKSDDKDTPYTITSLKQYELTPDYFIDLTDNQIIVVSYENRGRITPLKSN